MNVVKTVKAATKPARKIWERHDSGILTAVTMISTGAAVFFALKDGPKCKRILDEKKKEGASNIETAKAVLPAAGRTMMAVAVAWGASLLNHKRTSGKIAALAEALSIYRSLQDDRKVAEKDVVGEEKAREIDDRVAVNRCAEKPVIMSEVETTGHGTFIFREPMTGKTFRASKDYIELVVSKYSAEIERYYRGIKGDVDYKNYADEDFEVSMSDIFEDIGLSHCGFADLFVWPAREFNSISVNLNNTFEYEGPDGTTEPGYVLDFYTKPILGYSSYSTPSSWRY